MTRQTWQVAARDRWLLLAAFVGLALWLTAIGPLRGWDAQERHHIWLVGVAPSFFAAATFACWQAFAIRSTPLICAVSAATVIAATEALQLVLPRYTADVWDVVAGLGGAAVALPVLRWRQHRRSRWNPKREAI